MDRGTFLVIFVLSIMSIFQKEEKMVQRKTYKYKYYRTNPETKNTTVGFVKIYRRLEDDQYVVYTEKSGDFILISPFGSNEYECTGSCVCEDDSRRSYSTTMVKGLMYVAAAVSSVIAYNVAIEYFKEECTKSYENTCQSGSIRARVDDCVIMAKKKSDIPQPPLEEGEDGPIYYDDSGKPIEVTQEIKDYQCYGECVHNIFMGLTGKDYSKVLEFKKRMKEYYRCSDIFKDVVAHGGVVTEKFFANHFPPGRWTQKMYVEIVFMKEELDQHCRQGSGEKFMTTTGDVLHMSICVGYNKNFENPSVHCEERQMPRIPKGYYGD